MAVLQYKGYQAEVTFSDDRLLIHVLHVTDFISAECISASDVELTFRQLIEDYLEDCRHLGREPAKPYSGKFNVRVSPGLHRKAAMCAAAEELSLNAFVEKSLQAAVDDWDNSNASQSSMVDFLRSVDLRAHFSESQRSWHALLSERSAETEGGWPELIRHPVPDPWELFESKVAGEFHGKTLGTLVVRPRHHKHRVS